MTAPTELIKGNTLILILSCVSREDMHGYRIAREIERMSEGYFALGEGTLYPHLHQLEKDGLIEGYWVAANVGRNRKCYRITEKGRTELARRTREWKVFETKLNHLLDPGLPDSEPA